MLFSIGDFFGRRSATFIVCFCVRIGMSAGAIAQPISNDVDLATSAQQAAISGDLDGAFSTAASIADEDSRQQTLGRISILRQVSGLPGGTGQQAIQQRSRSNGPNGGLSEADFDSLIDLITGSIGTESWIDTGSGIGTIQAFPTGVSVDAKGTLQKIAEVDRGQSMSDSSSLRRLAPTENRSNKIRLGGDDQLRDADVKKSSSMRVVSLNRLERQTQLLTAQGKALTESMKNLAGLREIKFVGYLPDSNDVVIAGPGGPWKADPRGRSICEQTGKPILQLDDLVVCLQNAMHADGRFGCAIVPRQKNLAATKNFLATSKLKGKAWRTELRNVLGQQDIEVYGISPATHTAYVLVEADYRMKLIGMGLEPSIAQVPSYLQRVQLDATGNPPPLDVARWWFTLNYDQVRRGQSPAGFTFSGAGVEVLSETEFIDAHGKRIHTGNSIGPTKTFAKDFTAHFEKLADKYPIYQELKNVFDLAMAANLIQHRGLAKQAAWKAAFFVQTNGHEAKDGKTFVSTKRPSVLSYPFANASTPRQVDTVMNDRAIRQRVKSKTRRHTIVGVSGGVSADFQELLSSVAVDPAITEKISIPASPDLAPSTWWWDQQ